MNIIVVALSVSHRPLWISDIAVGQSRGRIEHRVIGTRLIKELEPLLWPSIGIERTRRARCPIRRGVKMIQTRYPVPRAPVIERRSHELKYFLRVFHHMAVSIDISVRHMTSYAQKAQPRPLTIFAVNKRDSLLIRRR